MFGKATQLLQPNAQIVTGASADADRTASRSAVQPQVLDRYRELGVAGRAMLGCAATIGWNDSPESIASGQIESQASTLALASMLDLGVFFAVLLVGFAYVWRRGDLDWVRAVRHPPTAGRDRGVSEAAGGSDSIS